MYIFLFTIPKGFKSPFPFSMCLNNNYQLHNIPNLFLHSLILKKKKKKNAYFVKHFTASLPHSSGLYFSSIQHFIKWTWSFFSSGNEQVCAEIRGLGLQEKEHNTHITSPHSMDKRPQTLPSPANPHPQGTSGHHSFQKHPYLLLPPPHGSGKTALARQLQQDFSRALIFGTDFLFPGKIMSLSSILTSWTKLMNGTRTEQEKQ